MTVLGRITPCLRMFDAAKAREFYVGFLGFRELFAHTFGDNFPLYLGLARDECELHLTEHYGDATPGSYIRITTTALDAFAAALARKDYRYAKPGAPTVTPWGTKELTITDPFGNRLTFVEAEATT